MLFPAHCTRAHKCLHATCLSSASLHLRIVSVWGWLVHGTSLKIDIRSLCKRRLTKKWEGMKAHEEVRECDKDRERQRVGERKKGREGETQNLPLHQASTQRKQTHTSVQVWNGARERKWTFEVRGMRQFSRKVNGDRCREQRCREHRWQTKPQTFIPYFIQWKSSYSTSIQYLQIRKQ